MARTAITIITLIVAAGALEPPVVGYATPRRELPTFALPDGSRRPTTGAAPRTLARRARTAARARP